MSDDSLTEKLRRALIAMTNSHIFVFTFLASCFEHILNSDDREAAKAACCQALMKNCDPENPTESRQKLESDTQEVFSDLVDGFERGPCKLAMLAYGKYVPTGTWGQVRELLAGKRQDLDSSLIVILTGEILNGLLRVFDYHRMILHQMRRTEPEIAPSLVGAYSRIVELYVAGGLDDDPRIGQCSFLLLGFWDAFSRSGTLDKDLFDKPNYHILPPTEEQLKAYKKIRESTNETYLLEKLDETSYQSVYLSARYEQHLLQQDGV